MKTFVLTLAIFALACGSSFAQKKSGADKPALPDPATVPVLSTPVVTAKNTSLVKVNATSQPWNFRVPWQKIQPGARRGLGVLLEKNEILVTAQLIADSTYIELEQADSGRRLPAKVKAVDYDANLALLEPAIPPGDFFKNLKAMSIETNARINDELHAWQLDRVGELVVTPVTINKIQIARYFLDTSLFLSYEVNGLIRSEANSFTLPVVKGGKLAGMLLSYDSKNQTATVLPGPIIAHFLKDMADGNYQGFPSLGIETQQTLDEQFHEYIGLKDDQQGVYVSAVSKGGSAESIGIKVGDIILAMNDLSVDARGDYQDKQFGRLSMSHLVRGQSFVGDEVKIKVLREGKPQTLTGKLVRKAARDYLVPPYLFDRGANFLVMGGLIFQELSMPYLHSFGTDWENTAPLRLIFVAKHSEEYEKQGRHKVIILAGALSTRSTQGYERLGGLIVTQVNGKPVNDMSDLDKAFKEPQDSLHKIEFEDAPNVIWLDAITAERDNTSLLDGVYRLGTLKRIE